MEIIDEQKMPVMQDGALSDSSVVIVSGMSGAGRTEAMHIFEDLGYYCVDNLPSSLIEDLIGLEGIGNGASGRKLAVVCDTRSHNFSDNYMRDLDALKSKGIPYKLVFLDASDEKLIARYKASRRPHPLCSDGASIHQGIIRERDLLFLLKESAHIVLDTTDMLPPQLRKKLYELFSENESSRGMKVTVYSFGFKYGSPADADLVIDVRFLPNPYYVGSLKNLTGLDKPVQDYVLLHSETEEFLARWKALLDCLMPGYQAEGKHQLAIAVGCTGGQHRSVTLAEVTGDYLKMKGYSVSIAHRDLDRAVCK